MGSVLGNFFYCEGSDRKLLTRNRAVAVFLFYSIRLRVPQFTIFEQIVKRVGVGLTSSLLALDARLR